MWLNQSLTDYSTQTRHLPGVRNRPPVQSAGSGGGREGQPHKRHLLLRQSHMRPHFFPGGHFESRPNVEEVHQSQVSWLCRAPQSFRMIIKNVNILRLRPHQSFAKRFLGVFRLNRCPVSQSGDLTRNITWLPRWCGRGLNQISLHLHNLEKFSFCASAFIDSIRRRTQVSCLTGLSLYTIYTISSL